MTTDNDTLVALATQITPGPWREGARFSAIVADHPTGHDDDRSVMAYGGHLVCESVKDFANASLLALAPDLLAETIANRARIEALEAEVERLTAERDEWRNDFRALEKAIVGDTGLSAMTVAAQARLFRPRAERAEAQLTEARAGEDELREALAQYANPDLYRSHPHGLAFDRRDKSYIAIAALASHDKRKEKR